MAAMRWPRLLIVVLVVVTAGWPTLGLTLAPLEAQTAADAPMSDACKGCNDKGGATCPRALCAVQPALASSPLLVMDGERPALRPAFVDDGFGGHIPGVPRPPPRLSGL
jgi:hypothetical protein